MIRINLLPIRAVKKQELGRKQLFLFALVLVGAAMGNYYWYDKKNEESERLVAQVAAVKKEIAELDRIIGEVKNIAKEKQSLEEKLKVLETLKRGRTGPVKMLDALATATPKNVWLRKFDEKAGALAIEGSAISNDDLAEYMKSLANVVWTPKGMGRLVENRRGATESRVELSLSGDIEEFSLSQVKPFFGDITLKQASQKTAGDTKIVDFSLTFKADYAI
ncbi:MAG TPA: pilus assembly protein PilN [Myxococcales bacterium]|jgi:type IV pilus assembly protein PilN|nr:pilus assembly protein PilN [Myxococcales bacterium]